MFYYKPTFYFKTGRTKNKRLGARSFFHYLVSYGVLYEMINITISSMICIIEYTQNTINIKIRVQDKEL